MEYLHPTSFGIGLLGVLVIVFGVAGGVVRFFRAEYRAACGAEVEEDRKRLRHVLGYYLLLGLEFLIAADIIDTLIVVVTASQSRQFGRQVFRCGSKHSGCHDLTHRRLGRG